jgi:hypothetical protein
MSTADDNQRFLNELVDACSHQDQIDNFWDGWCDAARHVLDGENPDEAWHDVLAVIGFAAHDLLWRQRAVARGGDAHRSEVIEWDLHDLVTVCWNWSESRIRDEIADQSHSSIIPVVKTACACALKTGNKWVAERSAARASA